MAEGQTIFYVAYFFWISVFCGAQAQVFFNDALNPVKAHTDVWQQRSARLAVKNGDTPDTCTRPNVYICEVSPDTVPPEHTKQCQYRSVNYHEQVYRWVAGRGCLLYTPDFLYVAGANTIDLNSGCFYGNLYAPCLEIVKEDGTCGCYPFDPGLPEVVNAVRNAIIPGAHGRWERCFYEAVDCCSHYMGQGVSEEFNNVTYCPATFDGWTCWPDTEADTLAFEVCSEFAYSNVGPTCNHFSSKPCYANGTWEIQTDYSSCSVTPRLLRRYRFHIAILAFSVAACLPAVFVFFFYKRLRVTRVALHRNLLIAIILRNLAVIVSRSEIYIDELSNSGDTVMSTHGMACRVLAVLERAAGNAVFVCMLVEGVYLHRMIVAVFRRKLDVRFLYGTGAVITIVPVLVWAFVMGYQNDHSCWLVYTVESIQWILDAPRIAILLINTILFVDILRVLLTKIRNAENSNQLNTTKATLFLMPLFGSQFLLTAFRPNTTNCTGEQIYYYFTYTVEGLQGFIVAMLYCYVNKEVHLLVKSTYKKTETAVVSRVRTETNYRRPTLGINSDRRMTYSTGLEPQSVDNDDKHQYATIPPKLHVAEIISIQASERLAEILEPVYETVAHGVINEGYDSLERSDVDSGFSPNRNSKVDDYYGFTNASSVSIECQDWIRCISSPPSSIYNNSLNDYEIKYLERKFPNQIQRRIQSEGGDGLGNKPITDDTEAKNVVPATDTCADTDNSNYGRDSIVTRDIQELETEFSGDEDMLEEILQIIETKGNEEVVLNPEALAPNRKDSDKIVFVNE